MGGEIEFCHKLYENYEQWSIRPESNGYIAYKYVYIAHYFALIWINIYWCISEILCKKSVKLVEKQMCKICICVSVQNVQ